MRVMHVMAGAAEGGAENIMLESVLALAEAGLTQHVVTRPDNQFRVQKFREAGIGVDVAAFNNAWPFPTRRVLGDAIKAFKPDVIEYWMGRAGQFAPKEYRNRSIGWYGGYYKLARFVNCEWHIGLTIDLLRHIREQGVSDDRSGIVHTYADFEGADPVDRASLDTPEDAPVALALARLHEKKGLDTLLDATAKVPGLYVWIAGEGPLEAELRAHCKRLNLDDRVRFLGWRNDRGALLAACDVVAFPSRYEPFGTVTVDAWAASRPLVAADAVGPAAYVKDGENGVLIPKNDVDALANALSKVISDKDFAAKIVAGGRASYEAQFNKAAFQRDSKAFYQKIIDYAGPFPG
ncbi:glycosyltransferase [Hyphomonas sp.]|jgi:glycosyltransferase involved in cell wall biosynthesis|uniref:glycosyltransferase n=1 Tax=Hyphomonas sp. TaxID=87 RepID=UPI000C3C1DED|nr:glycosyltransferase [Hyphomonas sp.]MAB10857.1 glycosyl transferase [Hyphomonas sp.]MAU66627.1 glycosyl transferase [Hyphomonas sp.]MBM58714.1 glycosyl transferase [Hyphomonas sp.]